MRDIENGMLRGDYAGGYSRRRSERREENDPIEELESQLDRAIGDESGLANVENHDDQPQQRKE